MEKNTIIAVVLSALVLFVSMFVQTVFVAPRQQVQQMQQEDALQQQQQLMNEQVEAADVKERESAAVEEAAQEVQYAIKTNKVKATFTTKGGDLVSYKILEHLDKDRRLKDDDRVDFNDSVEKLYSLSGLNPKDVLLDENTAHDKDKISAVVKKLEEIEKNGITDPDLQDAASKVREILAVEMVDNVTDTNRALGLTFGDSNQLIRNEIFNVKFFEDNPYKIGFFSTYEMKDDSGNPKNFTLFKTYTFNDDEYVFRLDINVSSKGGFGIGGNSYTIRTSPQIGPFFDQENNRYDVRQYVALNGGSKKVKKDLEAKTYDKAYDWAGVAGKYFTMLIKPATVSTMQPKTVTSVANQGSYKNSQLFLYRDEITEDEVRDTYYVYIGPRSESELKKYNKIEDNKWKLSEAKLNEAMQTGGFLNWIEIILNWAMENINKLVSNWGVSIIILTIILKIILFPLNKKTSLGSIKMQQLQPRMKELQDKYKGDPRKLQLETSKLYKEIGYNPMAGCLPMIFQMVILFALYNVFNNYFEFRGAKFISGWIDDLSVGDSIFKFDANIPLVSGFTMNTIRLLPIVYTLSQLISGKITQFATASTGKQMKFMTYGLPLIFFFLFYNVPSGLLLYWTTSNILQIFQQMILNSMMKKKRLEMELNKPAVNANVLKFKGGKKKTR